MLNCISMSQSFGFESSFLVFKLPIVDQWACFEYWPQACHFHSVRNTVGVCLSRDLREGAVLCLNVV